MSSCSSCDSFSCTDVTLLTVTLRDKSSHQCHIRMNRIKPGILRCMREREPVSETLFIVPHVLSQKHGSLLLHAFGFNPVHPDVTLRMRSTREWVTRGALWPNGLWSFHCTEIKEPGSVRESLVDWIHSVHTYVCVNSRSMEQLLSEKREPCFCEGTCGTMYL